MFLRLLSSATLLQGKRKDFKRKIAFWEIWSLGRYCECRVLATCSSWTISECHQVATDGENLSGTRISAASRWGFEKFSFLIYSPLRTESCLEKPAVESYSLIFSICSTGPPLLPLWQITECMDLPGGSF